MFFKKVFAISELMVLDKSWSNCRIVLRSYNLGTYTTDITNYNITETDRQRVRQ